MTSERCLNTIGPTLGGGLGPQYGLRGPLIDSLVSAHLVTASGDIVDVSESENSDLFWAIRGAGANFGIVTSATYRIYPPINNGEAVLARFSFSPVANRSVFELMEYMNEDYPPEMAGGIAVGYNHTSGQVCILRNMISVDLIPPDGCYSQRLHGNSCFQGHWKLLSLGSTN